MRMMYLLKNAVRGMLGNLKGNVIFFLVLCVSLAPADYVCGMIAQIQQNTDLASYTKQNVDWIAEFYAADASARDIRELFTEICPDMEGCEFLADNREMVYFEGNKIMIHVSGISEGYLDMEGSHLIAGENPWDSADYTDRCLLKNNSVLLEHGVGIGDRIEIGNHSYEVAGIINIPYGYGGIYIPYDSFAEGKTGSLQYKVLVSGGDTLTADDVKRFLGQRTEMVIQVSRAEDIDRMYETSAIANVKKRADIFSVILIFALFGVIVTSLEKIYEDRYRLGVELACGASKGQILSEITIQNLMIGLIAIGVDTILLECFRILFRLTAIGMPGMKLLLFLYLGTELLLFLVTAVCLFFLFHKKTETTLLNEGHENVC